MPRLDLPTFVARWGRVTTSERASAQSHFNDLCDVFDHAHPLDVDPTGAYFTFEKGAKKDGGGDGWADVWYRNHFAWEYKGKHKDLKTAYQQVQRYREDLENPPLLVVCDLNRFEVHTNFTGTVKQVYAFDLDDLLRGTTTDTCALPPLVVLRRLFEAPEVLRPQATVEQATEAAAREFAALARRLQESGTESELVARFLMRLLFCLFAEDVDLLPNRLFSRMIANVLRDSKILWNNHGAFTAQLRGLFAQMVTGGFFGADVIVPFNGGLFDDDAALPLARADIELLERAARLDWSQIEPTVFGTLFERILDPGKRAQLGKHYTSKADILLITEPVLMAPLRRRWAAVREEAETRIVARDAATGAEREALQDDLIALLRGFSEEIAAVRVLDPACGSGNFLYVALRQLLDLEKEVITYAARNGASQFAPQVHPRQLRGIELNEYAHELAGIVVWIGYIQWLRDNGFGDPELPILRVLDNIVLGDALITPDENGLDMQPPWPDAAVIIGNPPFLGSRRFRSNLGDAYVNRLLALYRDQMSGEADLVTYWFERARALVADGKVRRVGLLATNSIRGGANRRVLDHIKGSGDIFMAWADRPWVLDGAAVRVSMIGFDSGAETERTLDGQPVAAINADPTGALDLTAARRLPENLGLAFMGGTKGGPFDLTSQQAAAMLAAPLNPNGKSNSDVVRPWVTGIDLTRRPRRQWIVDFGMRMTEADAALYEQPYEYIRTHVKPMREKNNRAAYRDRWWIHAEARPAMRKTLASLPRYIGTSIVAKHRMFVWLPPETLPENLVIVIARADDYFFGVLHSRAHELWSLRLGTFLGVGNDPRYTPTTTFETFPFPWSPGAEPAGDATVAAIADAARVLVERRDAWLNPPDAAPAVLAKRTLTALYNERPAWLAMAHTALDNAVSDAYGWPDDLSDAALLERLLALNGARAVGTVGDNLPLPLTEVDETG